MKHWCYYTDVVRYLERLERVSATRTQVPAYLVWVDDDGPHMIAGPGIEWYRGDGPMPDIDTINIAHGAARVSKRSPSSRPIGTKTRGISTRGPCCASSGKNKRRTNFLKSSQTCSPRTKRANKRRTNLVKSAQTRSPRTKKQQSRGRQPAVNTSNNLPSTNSNTATSPLKATPSATTRNQTKMRCASQSNALRRALFGVAGLCPALTPTPPPHLRPTRPKRRTKDARLF